MSEPDHQRINDILGIDMALLNWPQFGAGRIARMRNRKSLSDAIRESENEWIAQNGKCAMCLVDRPSDDGMHRGQYNCGNLESCTLCHGCLPPGEQCRACGRINVWDTIS